MEVNIDPNVSSLLGIARLRTIVGAATTVCLILSVLALIISSIVWGFGVTCREVNQPVTASRYAKGALKVTYHQSFLSG